jgi:hypothetical protein
MMSEQPGRDQPELKIEDLLMSLRSVLFKSEDILSQFFCIESKEITFKDLCFFLCCAREKWPRRGSNGAVCRF